MSEMDLINELVVGSKRRLPRELQQAVDLTNASYPTYQPAPKTFGFYTRPLNVAGMTIKKGPFAGQVLVGIGSDLERQYLPGTLAHETYHQRVGKPIGDVYPSYELFNEAMGKLQPRDQFGPYWGVGPDKSPEEQLASLYGYEGSLPKGTPITQSSIATQLFGTPFGGVDQSLKNYYFQNASRPYGGLWEGQDDNLWQRAKTFLGFGR